ncbi:hypothetical protein HYFRA_00010599 [Hymenoscyphus fraxineus]|uniref:Methyltransferase domain-containing protein n=1 Tax=Hymenoscyphus fraxineus TaxID=746836 RepID=A0A9N9L9F5_9HELO|nr:hypothetical protein HYFRA_00010599 [Hymenoscyphus fraxineus]
MSPNTLKSIKSYYNARAPSYDTETNFHPYQASDYLHWISPKAGMHILDLACGTGAITLPLKRAVGPTGRVVGADISDVSLGIARSKAVDEGLEIEWVEGDISTIHTVQGIQEGGFDVVSCAAALVLLKEPGTAVREWARLLKPGGMLITDVLTGDTMVRGILLDRVAEELGVETVHSRVKLDSGEKVMGLLSGAGLDGGESFLTKSYAETKYLDVEKAGEMFDALFEETSVLRTWYAELVVPSRREKSKEIFEREMKKLAGPDGKVVEYVRFHMAIGRKV